MNPIDILLQSLDIFVENKHWPELKPSEIFKIIFYAHNKGWLYAPTANGKVQCVICAYRISEVNEQTLLRVPLKEEGNILYVPFFLSLNKEENIFRITRETLKIYLENNPDVTEMVLQDKNEKIKRYSLRGDNNENAEIGITGTAVFSR